MSTHGLDTKSAVLLRGTCAAVVEFLREAEERLPMEKQRDRAKLLRVQLESVLASCTEALPFDEIAAIVLAAPGVDSGFLQKTCELAKTNAVRVPGGAGAFIHRHTPGDGYRVWLHNGNKGCEGSGDDLMKAVCDAFAGIGVKLPAQLEKAFPEEE